MRLLVRRGARYACGKSVSITTGQEAEDGISPKQGAGGIVDINLWCNTVLAWSRRVLELAPWSDNVRIRDPGPELTFERQSV
jgi:glutamine synthetase adenylyltransferase